MPQAIAPSHPVMCALCGRSIRGNLELEHVGSVGPECAAAFKQIGSAARLIGQPLHPAYVDSVRDCLNAVGFKTRMERHPSGHKVFVTGRRTRAAEGRRKRAQATLERYANAYFSDAQAAA